ncbi:MAG: acyl-CoA reductase [Bacteroidia bacterium]
MFISVNNTSIVRTCSGQIIYFCSNMKLKERVYSFHLLGEQIREFLSTPFSRQHEDWNVVFKLAETQNGWFTRNNIIKALHGIEPWLNTQMLEKWLSFYPGLPAENKKPLAISVVMAGNIPLVGFHDFLCVLITGNIIEAKLSHADNILLPFIANKLIAIDPRWEKHIKFTDKLSLTTDAIIATGNNNTARHFEYYFRNVPHIIRKNRNGIAILDGTETNEELSKLGNDIFNYFGLGCRNISKLYVPEGYDFSNFFRAIEKFKDIINHHKYANNYAYNRTIYLMDGKVFTDNGFLAVIEDKQISSPIAVLHFKEYKSIDSLCESLLQHREQIQCIAANEKFAKQLGNLSIPVVEPGETQSPKLWDYADGVDVMEFILEQSLK